MSEKPCRSSRKRKLLETRCKSETRGHTFWFSLKGCSYFFCCLAHALSTRCLLSFRPDIASIHSCRLLLPGFFDTRDGRLAFKQEAVRVSSFQSLRFVLHVVTCGYWFRAAKKFPPSPLPLPKLKPTKKERNKRQQKKKKKKTKNMKNEKKVPWWRREEGEEGGREREEGQTQH